MKIDDVLKLVDAGFTRADILALAAGQVDHIETQEPQKQEPQEQEPEPEQDQKDTTREELQTIKAQISAMQRANLQSAAQPDGANKKQTSEDVWKEFFEGDKK